MTETEAVVDYVRNQPIMVPVAEEGAAPLGGVPLDLDKLPDGVVSGNTLIDFKNTPSGPVRAGVSLSMLFASRVASGKMQPGNTDDDWLGHYRGALSLLGFAGAGFAKVQSHFEKDGLFVHQAIIPWLTMALGGAALGPIIIAGLKNLKDMGKDKPWITLFERESRRFTANEMHFAAVETDATESRVHYAVARLDFAQTEINILFFKLTRANVAFESASTTLSVNNSLMATSEADLRLRLEQQTRDFIREAKF